MAGEDLAGGTRSEGVSEDDGAIHDEGGKQIMNSDFRWNGTEGENLLLALNRLADEYERKARIIRKSEKLMGELMDRIYQLEEERNDS